MDINNLELVSFLKDGEDWITSDEMLKRAGDSLTDYDELLANQKDIPESWRDYYIVFPKVPDRTGNRYVLYLRWSGEQWVVSVYWLRGGFDRFGRFVRSRELDPEKLDTWPLETLEINGYKYKLCK